LYKSISGSPAFSRIYTNLIAFFRHPAALAVGLTFTADSLMFGTWVTQIPFIKTRLGLDDGELGLALFGMPLGLLVMNPVSPWLMQKFGLVRITVWSTIFMAFTFVLPMWMMTRWSLFGVLFLIGSAVALMNVGMNTCATNIEEAEGRKIMSTCHGMWSLGGMVGSGFSALMIRWGVFPPYHLTIQAIILAVVTLLFLRPALSRVPVVEHHNAEHSNFAFPKGDLLLMILIGTSTSMCEGVAFDWSAVYLRDSLGAVEQVAALGFMFFSLSMMAMRFIGDALIPSFGERRLLYFTVFASVIALVMVIASTSPMSGLFGFFLLGMGVALAAPILFNACARVPGFAPGAGLASYATFSFIGFLMGPPVIGLIGREFGLDKGFMMVAVCTACTILAVRKVGYLR
jgi:predicted MFS family arabinose efflux permease